MMKVLVACDSYKGCLTSKDVNEAMALGVRDDDVEVVCIEMSDGGEGMLDAFLAAMHGERVTIHAHDALMRRVEACYGIVRIAENISGIPYTEGDEVAVVEIAQTAGLAFVEPEQRNPLKATSFGVGETIVHAYRHGIRRFVIGLGGSATSDCGIGMLKAMGDDWKKIRENCTFVLASDVTNPLCGENGAAHVFAPQKGADASMVEMLDDRARRFAEVSARHFGTDMSNTPGAGAAGGLGYAFLQYFNAMFMSGAELLLAIVGFDDMLADVDIVITGEGHSDRQTLMGKLPQRILEHVLAYRKSKECLAGMLSVCSKNNTVTHPEVWLVSGGVSDEEELMAAGFDKVVAVTPKEMPLRDALKPEVARRNIILKSSSAIRC